MSAHTSVLLAEVLDQLAPREGMRIVDATLGRGGHSEALLEAGAEVFGIDRDSEAIEESRARLERFGPRFTAIHGTFGEARTQLDALGIGRVDAVLADLGVSSPQLDQAERGFSFRSEGPLDMRMDPSKGPSASDLIAELEESELADVLYQLGEERRSRPIARAIKRFEREGRLRTTLDLRAAVVTVLGPRRSGGIDPATRTFQALRLAVNRELDELRALLNAIPDLLVDGGAIAIISFHSLEDRAVKHHFKADPRLSPTTKKPIVGSEEELRDNPRARSAKLRVARFESDTRSPEES